MCTPKESGRKKYTHIKLSKVSGVLLHDAGLCTRAASRKCAPVDAWKLHRSAYYDITPHELETTARGVDGIWSVVSRGSSQVLTIASSGWG